MIKCAVIGTGYLGRFHAQKYAKSEKTELVAVVDIIQERAEKVAAEVGCLSFVDYSSLPALGIQCASVVSDTSSHFEIASWLLANGIDVLVEKPMTTTAEEARELIRLAHAHKRVLQVGHLERFNPAFRAARGIVEQPKFFEARRIAPFSGRAFDIDVMRDLMIHDIDIIAHLARSEVERIEAVGIPVITSSVDIANARLTFRNGAIANVTASRTAFASERTIRIFGAKLYLSLDFGNRKLKICRVSQEKDAKGFPLLEVEEVDVEERDALRDEIESFVAAVETRATPEVPGEDGLRAILLAEKVERIIVEQLAAQANLELLPLEERAALVRSAAI